jgi:hypothetical protein
MVNHLELTGDCGSSAPHPPRLFNFSKIKLMTNIPAGYNDNGERGFTSNPIKFKEDTGDRLECYNCGRVARKEGAMIVKGKLVCEDCFAELNFK